jgi:cytoplasmic iron level regulating protein YaaA (DUF328/UPF0246 family)
MLFLISPAKSLDFETPAGDLPHTLPQFPDRSEQLIEALRKKSPAQLSRLMDISGNLATLNAQRYRTWSPKFTARNAKQAVLAFDGDVYDGLQAKTLKPPDLQWAQEHLCILSGLHGVLRPMDWIQPYRLEMGTALTVGRAKSLYQFWGSRISEYLNERVAQEKDPVVVNLASQEYFRSVDPKALRARVIECVFEEDRGGTFKVISFSAKRARGMMARHAIMKRMTQPRQLESFAQDGYAFAPAASTPDRLVFRRKMPP